MGVRTAGPARAEDGPVHGGAPFPPAVEAPVGRPADRGRAAPRHDVPILLAGGLRADGPRPARTPPDPARTSLDVMP
ncbi:hypothetical protein SNE510_70550 [Streptomyces sp. NE5-10]|nr:hypothetical protein SNE510_70550 [Streptomyces sp. NE5-10]